MFPKLPAISRWLERTGAQSFAVYSIVAAFSTYFCMYAFRKPFTAGEYLDTSIGQLPFKPVLVAIQVLGYTCAKFLGVKYVSEVKAEHRARTIVCLILLAEVTLLLFAVTPRPWNATWLFFNGLCLGMVFGFVVVFLEGRRMSEALVAGLCASFIISSGVVKSVGRYVIGWGVSEYWMPFATGLMFVLPLLLAVWLLNHLPQPNAGDVAHRTQRSTMDKASRWAFYRRHAFGLTLILLPFMALTVIRGIRDDFGVEIWAKLGHDEPSVFAKSETWVTLGVVVISGATIFLRDNRKAFLLSLLISGIGFAICLAVCIGQQYGMLGFATTGDPAQDRSTAFLFMVLLGFGMNLPYLAVHTTIFERLIACFRETATMGFLMCLADALGYLAYVGVVFWDNFGKADLDYLGLLNRCVILISAASLVITAMLIVYYWRTIPIGNGHPIGNTPDE